MSHDLERLFSSFLPPDSAGARLAGPEALRKRGDRRGRGRAVAGLVAVAVVVAGTVVGAREVLTGSIGPQPQVGTTTSPPGPSPSATPSPSPAPSPSPSPSPDDGAAEPVDPPAAPPGCDDITGGSVWPAHAGQPLPKEWLLRGSDWSRCHVVIAERPGYPVPDPARGYPSEPDVCKDGAGYAADAKRVAGRFRFYNGGPEVYGYESLTRYQPGAAKAFLAEIRSRVARCATFKAKDDGLTWYAKIEARDFAGDESLLVYVGTGPKTQHYPAGWYGIVRIGDHVIVVTLSHDLGGNRQETLDMTRKAANRVPG